MTRLTDKTHYAVGIGVITGVIIMTLSILTSNPVVSAEPVIETITPVIEIIEADCVEIVEYDLSTGLKTTIGCIEKGIT